jgi:hypothetical protein
VVGTVTYESYDFDELIAAERAAILPYALVASARDHGGALVLTVRSPGRCGGWRRRRAKCVWRAGGACRCRT